MFTNEKGIKCPNRNSDKLSHAVAYESRSRLSWHKFFILICLSSDDLFRHLAAAPQSYCGNLGSFVKSRIVVGAHSGENYGLPVDQQPRDEEKDYLVPGPHFEVSARHLSKTSWTGTDKDGWCECDANRAQIHLELATNVIKALRKISRLNESK